MPQTINNENEYRLTRSKVDHPIKEDAVDKPLSSTVLVNTREYLGDLSNQDDSYNSHIHNSNKRRLPLGGDNQPLQQRIKPDAIPPRMPQKRQATESSTNLVEKLHPSIPIPGDSAGAGAGYKKSKLSTGDAAESEGDAGAEVEVDAVADSKVAGADNDADAYTWEDLDEEDIDDPLMVSEYVNDIFPYLRELEYKTLPDSQYLFNQKQLKPKMRSILVDWLVEMHLRFRLLPETLFLAINIMDRFMSLEIVQIDKLQLLATGSLFIAAKYEEVFSPSVKNYAYFTDGSYTEEEILQAEKFVLTVLNFDLSYPNPMNFLRRILKADDYDVRSRTLGKYLLEISIIDYKFVGMMPSLCSASAMYIARIILQKTPVWNGNLVHYSGDYRVEDMRECIEKIIAFLVSPVEHEEFHKKYASRKFMKASLVCRSWAKKVVNEGRDIFA